MNIFSGIHNAWKSGLVKLQLCCLILNDNSRKTKGWIINFLLLRKRLPKMRRRDSVGVSFDFCSKFQRRCMRKPKGCSSSKPDKRPTLWKETMGVFFPCFDNFRQSVHKHKPNTGACKTVWLKSVKIETKISNFDANYFVFF